MENKELQRESINSKVIAIESEDEFKIKFENEDTIRITSYHEQDCCESVYADFSQVKHYVDGIIGKTVKEVIIKGIDGIGFLVCFYFDWEQSEKVFIPCYNSQNGYYSSNLSLVIDRDGIKKTIDISDFVEDNIG